MITNKSLLSVTLLYLVSVINPWTSQAIAFIKIGVTLAEDKNLFQGALYLPDRLKSPGPLPLVVVVHEWWGKTEYPEMRARQIAEELNYAALVVDLYGDGRTVSTPDAAKTLAGPFYQDPMIGVNRLQRFIAAVPGALKSEKDRVDLKRVAAIGYCFGGTQVLNLARTGDLPPLASPSPSPSSSPIPSDSAKLLGVVSFHGGLASSLSSDQPITAKVLVLHGAADKMVSPKDVADFKAEMKKRKAKMEFVAYAGALHAFTNPQATEVGKKFQIPVAYDAKADQASWKKMKGFLQSLFKK